MSLTFHWFLPTNGDSRHVVGGGHGTPVTAAGGDRPPTVRYLAQIARAAEDVGFTGVLTPTGAWCEDAWLTTAMVSQHTERLKFLVAFRPGFISPTLAAQMASTYQRQTGGRLLLNVVTGGESHEQRAYGDFLDKDARYARTGEFLEIVRQLWDGKTVDLDGDHLHVEQARLTQLPDPVPEVYFGGSSPAAGRVAARHSDVYLTWGEPPAQVAEKIAWIRSLAAEEGRTVRFGIRLHVITRDTSQAAWAEADRLLAGFDPATVRSVQEGLRRSESEGQRRMLELHGGGRDGLEIHPNLWAGIGLVRGGAGTALVGSHAEVADRIREYHALGIDEFVLSGYPHLEEAYWFGEGVLPRLAEAGLWTHPAGPVRPGGSTEIPFAGGAR
ncbi:LLM class flavin-dependent oxidoreductase [Streptomyces microflavus]|uniref:LLM class flavin-dependent oxidoreductase n=1 Tax=Streptomyces microflavus TaxID=1919 RepID=A0A7H8MID6_STRMI|nr:MULTISPECIES: LLM class flavin-dependent oxidoreductase [Streptomyces]MBW3357921.1 LLM class flavin-dependent oxidoreductase [Streptomyces sp. 09ZI22]MEE1733278.1 LLM class flavin-dependent oxidoreductase [Streptomyces sp. BE282]QKW42317.1 LLM class flavin-dependent oxidoreductase [Streptomyces microflavus]QTA31224.1 LLM class flavin-dependent oxidoreductase [Streptomyces sp. CA-256286]WSR90592.1 LLM class flavin-dependent oxidoreductase [Streptomyces microflavus]